MDDRPKKEPAKQQDRGEPRDASLENLKRKRESILNEIDRRLQELRAKKNSMITSKGSPAKLSVQESTTPLGHTPSITPKMSDQLKPTPKRLRDAKASTVGGHHKKSTSF